MLASACLSTSDNNVLIEARCIGFQLPIFNRLSLVKIKQTTFDCGEKEKIYAREILETDNVFFFLFFPRYRSWHKHAKIIA